MKPNILHCAVLLSLLNATLAHAAKDNAGCILKVSQQNTIEDLLDNKDILDKAGYKVSFNNVGKVDKTTYANEYSPKEEYLEILAPLQIKAGITKIGWTNLNVFANFSCYLEIEPNAHNLKLMPKKIKISNLSLAYVQTTRNFKGWGGLTEPEGTTAFLRLDLEQSSSNISIRSLNCTFTESESLRRLHPQFADTKFEDKLKLTSKKVFFQKENDLLSEKLCGSSKTVAE